MLPVQTPNKLVILNIVHRNDRRGYNVTESAELLIEEFLLFIRPKSLTILRRKSLFRSNDTIYDFTNISHKNLNKTRLKRTCRLCAFINHKTRRKALTQHWLMNCT